MSDPAIQASRKLAKSIIPAGEHPFPIEGDVETTNVTLHGLDCERFNEFVARASRYVLDLEEEDTEEGKIASWLTEEQTGYVQSWPTPGGTILKFSDEQCARRFVEMFA